MSKYWQKRIVRLLFISDSERVYFFSRKLIPADIPLPPKELFQLNLDV